VPTVDAFVPEWVVSSPFIPVQVGPMAGHPISYMDLDEDPIWFIRGQWSHAELIEALRSCLSAEVASQERVREFDDEGAIDFDEERVVFRSAFGAAVLVSDVDGSASLDVSGLTEAGRRALPAAIQCDGRFANGR